MCSLCKKRELKPIIPPFINFRITHAYPCSHIGGVNWNTKSKKIFEVLVLSIRGSVSDNAPRMESMNRNYGANRTSRWAGRILYVGAWIETNECKKFFCSYLWVLLMWGSVNWNDMRCLRLPAPHRTLYTGSVNWNVRICINNSCDNGVLRAESVNGSNTIVTDITGQIGAPHVGNVNGNWSRHFLLS